METKKKKRYKWNYFQNGNRLTREGTYGYQGGWKEDGLEFEIDTDTLRHNWDWDWHTAIFKIHNQQGPTV